MCKLQWTKNEVFSLRISSVNVTKSAGNCGVVTFTVEILNGKLQFFTVLGVYKLKLCKELDGLMYKRKPQRVLLQNIIAKSQKSVSQVCVIYLVQTKFLYSEINLFQISITLYVHIFFDNKFSKEQVQDSFFAIICFAIFQNTMQWNWDWQCLKNGNEHW